MKKLGKLKLNQLSKGEMGNKEMNYLKGGSDCGCSCYYKDSGGSSVQDNGNANLANDQHSYGGSIWCANHGDSYWYVNK